MRMKELIIGILIGAIVVIGIMLLVNQLKEPNSTSSDFPLNTTPGPEPYDDVTLFPKLDSSFEIKVDEAALIESENLKIKYKEVVEDSLCREVCAWQGQIVLLFSIYEGDRRIGDFDLTSLSGSPELSFGYFIGFDLDKIYEIKLVDVDHTSDYVATIYVSESKPPTGCTTWNDGCNTCQVDSGKVTSCTEIGCPTYSKPECLEF